MRAHVCAVMLLLGCSKPATPSVAAAEAIDATRTQYRLLGDIAQAMASDEETRASRVDAVRTQWHDRRVAWEVLRVGVLCARADSCAVVPVNQAINHTGAKQGWMPKLLLSDENFASLKEKCGAAEPCVVKLEARISELTLASDMPTSMALGQVTFVSARPLSAGENWFTTAH